MLLCCNLTLTDIASLFTIGATDGIIQLTGDFGDLPASGNFTLLVRVSKSMNDQNS